MERDFLSMLSSIAMGLQPSFFWPGSGSGSSASAGEMQWGTARCAVAGGSAITGGHPDGYLLLNTDHQSLHHIGSVQTRMLGHSGMVERSGGITFPQTAVWLVQEGSKFTSNAASAQTMQQSFTTAYSVVPSILQTLEANSLSLNMAALVSLSTVTTGGFISFLSLVGPGPTSGWTLHWRSTGTVSL